MSAKLEGIGRLERKLEEVTTNFTGELDLIKTELANLKEARNNDGIQLNRLQGSVKGIAKDLHRNEEAEGKIQKKLEKIDNTSNKNLERIDRLERNNAKLNDDMKLLEEREKRRSLGARPKVLEVLDSDRREAEKKAEGRRKQESSSTRNLSYSYQLRKGLSGMRSLSLLKELREAEENSNKKENNQVEILNSRPRQRLEVDLFAEARKCIGLYPVRARHILDFHEGDYNISSEDIPQLHDL